MKTTILRLTLCLMAITTAFIPATFSANKTDNDIIVISPRPNGGDFNGPRSTVNNPFGAVHSNGNIIITSDSNEYGIVDIQIINPEMDVYETDFDTSDGIIYCPIDNHEGQYIILITTGQGYVFEGVFVLI